MRSKIAERILANTPKETTILVSLYANLLVKINSILKEKGYTQKMLAEKLDKRPSEIHKWLSGEHNFTLRSLAKLQAELGETLLEIPTVQKHKNTFLPYKHSEPFTVYVNTNHTKIHTSKWQVPSIYTPEKLLENVG